MSTHLKVILALIVLAFLGAAAWNLSLRGDPPPLFAPDRTAQSALLAGANGAGPDQYGSASGGGSDAAGALTASRRTLFQRVRPDGAPAVHARSVIVADLETGEAYVSENPALRWPTASLTKLVTAAETLREIPLDASIPLRGDALSRIGDDGSGGLMAGETYLAKDLLAAAMVFSSNEAAEALASFAGREGFLEEMNQLVHTWGLTNTHFEDPTGLSAANQSTAADLEAAALHLYRDYPEIFALTRKRSAVMVEQASHKRVEYPTTNEFAGRPDFLGGKTGYTDEAAGNLLSLFAYENRPIIIIVLGSDDRFGATKALYAWFTNTYTSR